MNKNEKTEKMKGMRGKEWRKRTRTATPHSSYADVDVNRGNKIWQAPAERSEVRKAEREKKKSAVNVK